MAHLYNSLAKEIHQDNITAGWWKQSYGDDNQGEILLTVPRNIGELLCLVHSEISEGYLGEARNLQDDHLPTYPMYRVEMADTAIRIFDILGYYGAAVTFQEFEGLADAVIGFTTAEMTCLNHALVDEALEGFRKGNTLLGQMKLWALLDCLYQRAETEEWDFYAVIEAKREYNRNRADHKLENRAKPGGKAF